MQISYYIKQENKRNFPIEIEIEDISEKVVKSEQGDQAVQSIRIIKAEYNSKDLWNLITQP